MTARARPGRAVRRRPVELRRGRRPGRAARSTAATVLATVDPDRRRRCGSATGRGGRQAGVRRLRLGQRRLGAAGRRQRPARHGRRATALLVNDQLRPERLGGPRDVPVLADRRADGQTLLRHIASGRYVDGGRRRTRCAADRRGTRRRRRVRRGAARLGRADARRGPPATADVAVVVVGNHPLINGRETEDRVDLAPAAGPGGAAAGGARGQPAHRAGGRRAATRSRSAGPSEHLPAILWSAHGGQEFGHALADVLIGDAAPAGRLTQTWYRDAADLPDLLDYDIIASDATYLYFRGTPLYPFGHGLTYTTFEYSRPALRADDVDRPDGRDRGQRDGAQHRRPGRRRGGAALHPPAALAGQAAAAAAARLRAGAPGAGRGHHRPVRAARGRPGLLGRDPGPVRGRGRHRTRSWSAGRARDIRLAGTLLGPAASGSRRASVHAPVAGDRRSTTTPASSCATPRPAAVTRSARPKSGGVDRVRGRRLRAGRERPAGSGSPAPATTAGRDAAAGRSAARARCIGTWPRAYGPGGRYAWEEPLRRRCPARPEPARPLRGLLRARGRPRVAFDVRAVTAAPPAECVHHHRRRPARRGRAEHGVLCAQWQAGDLGRRPGSGCWTASAASATTRTPARGRWPATGRTSSRW